MHPAGQLSYHYAQPKGYIDRHDWCDAGIGTPRNFLGQCLRRESEEGAGRFSIERRAAGEKN